MSASDTTELKACKPISIVLNICGPSSFFPLIWNEGVAVHRDQNLAEDSDQRRTKRFTTETQRHKEKKNEKQKPSRSQFGD